MVKYGEVRKLINFFINLFILIVSIPAAAIVGIGTAVGIITYLFGVSPN